MCWGRYPTQTRSIRFPECDPWQLSFLRNVGERLRQILRAVSRRVQAADLFDQGPHPASTGRPYRRFVHRYTEGPLPTSMILDHSDARTSAPCGVEYRLR